MAIGVPERIPAEDRSTARAIGRLAPTSDELAYVLAMLAEDVTSSLDAARRYPEVPSPTGGEILKLMRSRIERVRVQHHADHGVMPGQETLL